MNPSMAARFFLLNTSSKKRRIRALLSSVDIVNSPLSACFNVPTSSMVPQRSLRYVTMQRPALSVGSQINDKKHSKLLSSQSVPASGNVRRGDACRRLPCTDDPRVEWPLGTSGLSLWYTQLYVAAP